MANPTTLEALARAANHRAGLLSLLRGLGFGGHGDEVPEPVWPAWGVAPRGDVAALLLAGTVGTLTAVVLELKGRLCGDTIAAIAGAIRRRNPALLYLFAFSSRVFEEVALATFAADSEFRYLRFEPERLRRSDLDALCELVAGPGETGLELALRHARALDRSRITRRFFNEFRARRNAVSRAWTGIPAVAERERSELALLLLSRLTFLYFLQRRGVLASDDRYLPHLFGAWSDTPGAGSSFYRARLRPLFFESLNRRVEERAPAAAALGPLPYLNGGLFEPHPHERAWPGLDLPDAEMRAIFDDLLERYRFTPREALGGGGFGVDPEVLGRVFEGLMEPDRRLDTGSYYTPSHVVHRMVHEAVAEYVAGKVPGVDVRTLLAGCGAPLDAAARYRTRSALQRVRVLDPACGSGAFLVGALHHLARALGAVSDGDPHAIRESIVARSLHGVDLLDDAALLCSLRLWIALADDGGGEVRPLPNLDRRIRQGDALLDPLDLAATETAPGDDWVPASDPDLRHALRALPAAARRYVTSDPKARPSARAGLARAEAALARHWVRALSARQSTWLRHFRAVAADRDLFGDKPRSARTAETACRRAEERLEELKVVARQLQEKGSLPFFSFGVHFAAAERGFDIIVSNPPWVRAHRWPARLRTVAAKRFEVCREPGWPAATRLTGVPAAAGAQVDLSLLFVERCVSLLAPGGVVAVLVPAKTLRALYGGAMRRILLRDLEFALIEDHSLDAGAMFRADTFPAVLVARRPTTPGSRQANGRPVRVHLGRHHAAPLEFVANQLDLPVFPGDPASPWLLAPPDAVAAFRAMQRTGAPLGDSGRPRVHRGVMTGANDVLLLRRAEPRLGGLCRVEAEGYRRLRQGGGGSREAARSRAYVETSAVRPLVRGADINAFCYRTTSYVVWCHEASGQAVEPPPRMGRYLSRHRAALEARPGWRPDMPLGAVFRVAAATLGPKVAWHDLSDTLRAVALPGSVNFDGRLRELVPLNTVYFLPATERDGGMALAGLLNSLPVRTFARAIAERAKDARFRFFAWTVACVPLPHAWDASPAGRTIRRISREAHAAGGLGPEAAAALDRAAAAVYGLGAEEVAALERFDRWLRGQS